MGTKIRMAGRGLVAAAVAVAVAALGAGVVSAAVSGGGWGTAQEVTGIAALNASTVDARLVSVSCASPGNCAAGGYYFDADAGEHGFVVDEKDGTWGKAQEVRAAAALVGGEITQVVTVSCASPGNCAAGGFYSTGHSSVSQAFVVSEVNGVWGKAIEVPGSVALEDHGDGASVTAVSCSQPGDCLAGGYYGPTSDTEAAFVVTESNGRWGPAEEVPGLAALNPNFYASVSGITCNSPGDCAIAGTVIATTPVANAYEPYVASESGGTWTPAQELAGPSGGALLSLSCPPAGNCAAGGYTGAGQAAVADESGGTWSALTDVPGLASLNRGNDAVTISVSCAAPGECSAGGRFSPSPANDPDHPTQEAFTVTETDGTWAKAEPVKGTEPPSTSAVAEVTSVSCATAGDCTAGGYYTDTAGNQQPFIATQAGGTWGSAEQLPGMHALNAGGYGAVNSVSCTTAGDCSAVGDSAVGGQRHESFVDGGGPTAATSTAVVLSASAVRYGDEQAQQVKATVVAGPGVPPAGQVTVTAGHGVALCTITLIAGSGSCAGPATRLAAGQVAVRAAYSGNYLFGPSASAKVSFTVLPARSKTSLVLSAPKVSSRHEESEHLKVKVSPQYAGTPAGTVTVKSGSTTICVIRLARGAGTCKLRARKLKPGTYHLVAHYPGSHNFTRSVSARKTLTVTR